MYVCSVPTINTPINKRRDESSPMWLLNVFKCLLSIRESPSLLYTYYSRGKLCEHIRFPSSVLTHVQPNLLRSTFDLLTNPFSVSLHNPVHQSHNVCAHCRHPVSCRFRGRPCTLPTHQVRCSIDPLDLEIVADLFATFPTVLT